MSGPHEPAPELTVTAREIHRIAALARVRLEQGEARGLARDMSSILEHMAVLAAIAPELVPPTAVARDEALARPLVEGSDAGDPPAEQDRTMPDPLGQPLSGIAPDWREGFFVVPRLPGVGGAPAKRDGSP